jgi:hypothetical protein
MLKHTPRPVPADRAVEKVFADKEMYLMGELYIEEVDIMHAGRRLRTESSPSAY